MRVAGGAVARLVIPEVDDRGDAWSRSAARADASRWEALLDEARAAGDSLGAVVECVATGVPAGWGAPRLRQARRRAGRGDDGDQRGQGRRDRRGLRRGAAEGRGNADPMRAARDRQPCRRHRRRHFDRPADRRPRRVQADQLDPHPVPSIDARQEAERTKGRHDPCVGIRGAPVVEAMMALVLADHKLLHRGQCG